MTKVENNVATSKNEGLIASPKDSGMVVGVGSLSNSFSEDNRDDVNAEEGVDSPSKSFSENAHDSDTDNCGALPSKSSSSNIQDTNKVRGSPSMFLSRDQQVKNCEN